MPEDHKTTYYFRSGGFGDFNLPVGPPSCSIFVFNCSTYSQYVLVIIHPMYKKQQTSGGRAWCAGVDSSLADGDPSLRLFDCAGQTWISNGLSSSDGNLSHAAKRAWKRFSYSKPSQQDVREKLLAPPVPAFSHADEAYQIGPSEMF